MRVHIFRWRLIRCGKLLVFLLFFVFLTFSVVTVRNLSGSLLASEHYNTHMSNPDHICSTSVKEFYIRTGLNSQLLTRQKEDGFYQSDVDYFAKNIKVIYRVVENMPQPALYVWNNNQTLQDVLQVCPALAQFLLESWPTVNPIDQKPGAIKYLGRTIASLNLSRFKVPRDYREIQLNDMMLYDAEITLVNKGNRVFPYYGWSIYFNQILGVEPGYIPKSSVVVRPEYGVQFQHLNGQLHSMSPTGTFAAIKPKEEKKIHMYSVCCSVTFTDVFPNWYIVFRGLSPRVMVSTVGEPDQFVALHNTSKSWKRMPDANFGNFDHFNPPTAKDRFTNDGVNDFGVAPIPVLPTPFNVETYVPSSTLNVFSEEWVIISGPEFQSIANFLAEEWRINKGTNLPGRNYIQFIQQEVKIKSRDKSLVPHERYELIVDPASLSITIKAAHPAGAFYAVQSLLGLTDQNGNVPETKIKDGPRYRYRGLMIDVARNFHNKVTIMRYINAMAMYKLNKLHLHLTDDEGWRLEIPDLPELTDIGGKRCHDPSETKCLLPFLGSGPDPVAPGSGFYTTKDYKEILRYAVAHHVEVIPEIDMPGHSHAAIKAMQIRFLKLSSHDPVEASKYLLTDLQDESQYNSIQNFNDGVINPCLQSSYVFIEKVISTLHDLHKDISPLQTFHFGGDEVPRSVWIDSPLCVELNATGITKTLKQIFAESVSDIAHNYNLSLGAWEDGLMNGETPFPRRNFPQKDIYVFAWNNLWGLHQAKRAYTLANQGYKVVLTPATTMYLDHPYEPDPRERGLIWAARFINTKKIFKFMPENIYISEEIDVNGVSIPECFQDAPNTECPKLMHTSNIEGIQGTLFGELTRTRWIMDYMIFPRLIALAERSWHTAPWEREPIPAKRKTEMEKDWLYFANTLGHRELARLDKKGFLYRIPPPGAIVKDNRIKVSFEFPGLEAQISMNGGKSWNKFPEEGVEFEEGKDIQLRTKAAVGDRYSKAVHVEAPTSNDA